jgi:hypothetical protein
MKRPPGMIFQTFSLCELEAAVEVLGALEVSREEHRGADRVEGIGERFGVVVLLRELDGASPPPERPCGVLAVHADRRRDTEGQGELRTWRQLLEHGNCFQGRLVGLLDATAAPHSARE